MYIVSLSKTMASSGKHVAAMGSSLKESKKNVECGGHTARRDYLKGTHFPKVHPGERYKEKGDTVLFIYVARQVYALF